MSFPTVCGGDNCHAIRQRQACTLRGLRRRVWAAKGRNWPFRIAVILAGHEGQVGVTVTPTSSPPSAIANAVSVGSGWRNAYTLCSLKGRMMSMVAVVALGSSEMRPGYRQGRGRVVVGPASEVVSRYDSMLHRISRIRPIFRFRQNPVHIV